jgi:hypothetical protein
VWIASPGDEETYRALGRYVVEFSRLVFQMRAMVIETLDSDPPLVAELTLGEANPNQIASVFFGACRVIANGHEGASKKIETRLMDRVVRDTIERRNDLAHGDWFVEPQDVTKGCATAVVIRIRPVRKEGALKTLGVTPNLLDEWADDVSALRAHVTEYGAICIGADPYGREGIGVADIFDLRGKEVVRSGPRAGDFPAYT